MTEIPILIPRPRVLSPNDKRIATVGARESLSLPPVVPTRGVTVAPSTYGAHFPNWETNLNDSMQAEIRATKPLGGLFMDNFTVDAIVLFVRICAEMGIEPTLIIRIYFPPQGGIGAGAVGAYISKAIERFRALLQRPEIRALAEKGKLWSKLLNETQIGTEGFPEGRAGFLPAQDVWMRTRNALVQEFGSLVKHGSIAMTPGHADTYFLGDTQNADYVFHGKEGANPDVLNHVLQKIANPSYVIPTAIQTKIAQARASRVLNPMFEAADGFFFHVYAQNEQQTKGDLSTWYARRFLVFQFWLANFDKPHFIPEFDVGYDQPEKYGELYVWAHTNIIDPNGKVKLVNRWWTWREGEGDPAWRKHGSRKPGGELQPHMNAIAQYRASAPAPDPTPTPTPTPNPTLPPRVLDPRLPQLGVTIRDAQIEAGKPYFRITKVAWENEQESGGTHHIFADVLDEAGKRIMGQVLTVTNGGAADITINKVPPDWGVDFPMYSAGNAYNLKAKGLPSDEIRGMGMGDIERRDWKIHVNYRVTFQRVVAPSVPVPTPSSQSVVKAAGDAAQVLSLNPNAAIQKKIYERGFVPTSPEYPVSITWAGQPNVPFVFQRAEHLGTGAVRYFGCKVGAWNVVYVTDGIIPLSTI